MWEIKKVILKTPRIIGMTKKIRLMMYVKGLMVSC